MTDKYTAAGDGLGDRVREGVDWMMNSGLGGFAESGSPDCFWHWLPHYMQVMVFPVAITSFVGVSVEHQGSVAL